MTRPEVVKQDPALFLVDVKQGSSLAGLKPAESLQKGHWSALTVLAACTLVVSVPPCNSVIYGRHSDVNLFFVTKQRFFVLT
jgi:hypothetical protein